jgi:hypothetical protein
MYSERLFLIIDSLDYEVCHVLLLCWLLGGSFVVAACPRQRALSECEIYR